MKFLKIGALAVTVAFFAGFMAATASAADEIGQKKEKSESYFLSVEGTIEKIHPKKDDSSNDRIEIKDKNGNPAYLVITGDTIFDQTDLKQLEQGDEIVAFVKSNSPMVMIYPPQYPVSVITANKDLHVKADAFDANGVSQDGFLKIRIGEETKVLRPDGSSYSGSIENRLLLVYYDVSTRSIPAQTTPKRIVVLSEEEVMPSQNASTTNKVVVHPDVTNFPLIVAGKKLEGASAFNRPDGTIMIPARATLEALGYQVTWDAGRYEVMVNQGVSSFKIGEAQYHFAKMAPIQLEAAPEIRDGMTYVPLSYFQRVLKINNAFVFEGQIEINNDEKMN